MRLNTNFYILCFLSILSLISCNFLSTAKFNLGNEVLNREQENTKIAEKENQEDHLCEQKTDMILKHFLNESEIPPEYADYYKFAFYSGTGLNDFGDYRGCEKLNISKYFIMKYSTSAQNTSISLQLGLCYFKECDQEYMTKSKYDIANLINKTRGIDIQPDNLVFIEPTLQLNDYRNRMLLGFIIFMSLFGLILILNFLQCFIKTLPKTKSTLIYDVLEEKKSRKSFIENENNYESPPSNIRIFFGFFDFSQNAKKIFEVKNMNNTYSALRIFDGVRILSTCWVVFGHTFIFPLMVGMKNVIDIPDLLLTFRFAIVPAGVYAVDVFFYMSAFLLYFTLQKYFNKKINKFKIFFLAVLNRYIRLLPLYLLIIFGATYSLPFFGSGPFYQAGESYNKYCEKFFWHNLLYINNVYPYTAPESMCAAHSWYLANDMQFFILSMIIFLFLNNHKIIRNIIFTMIFISSNVYSISEVYTGEYLFMDFNHKNFSNDWFDKFYDKPWNRICPYILGLYFCEFFLETPLYQADYNKNYKNEEAGIIRKINEFFIKSNVASFILFLFSLILINFAVFTVTLVNNVELSIFWHAMFNTFNKIFFVFGLGCIVHLTFLGKFVFIRDILSFNVFTYISRITYGIYLIHIYVLFIFLYAMDSFTYLKMGDFAFYALGVITITAFVSFIMSLVLESPVINAIKYFLEGRKSN